MLDTLKVCVIKTRKNSSSFEIILYPLSQFMRRVAVKSSAWNRHCAFLILMRLVVHPSIQIVEVAHQVELALLELDDAYDANNAD